MTATELLHRAELMTALYGKERRRNAELVHRLQQLHAERVDMIEIQRKHQDLQEAHLQQVGIPAARSCNVSILLPA